MSHGSISPNLPANEDGSDKRPLIPIIPVRILLAPSMLEARKGEVPSSPELNN